MKNIKIALWTTLIGLTALWALANTALPDTLSFIAVRNLLVQYSGVLGMGAMSVAMILATRATWLEPWLGGLDKSYRLHKWLGIAALVASVVHWLASNGPKWLAGLGLIEGRKRGPPPAGDTELGAIQAFFQSQRGTAELVGEWAFYATVLLIALALIKRFPYKLFASTHTLIAAAYLALVFHSLVLMNFGAWTQPVGMVTGLLMIGGVVSALLALTRQIGRRHRAGGTVESLQTFAPIGVTEIKLRLDAAWKGHEGGQFAFVTFEKNEGKHPFTIASAWDPTTRQIMFITKGLGDYTDVLPERIKAGDAVTVEGPYGRFTFDDQKPKQIWVSGGIGITPCIARMKQRAITPGRPSIDLIQCIPVAEPRVLALLKADAEAANVRLHVLVEGEHGRLSGERLREMLPDWKSASVWFCGPAAFGQSLRTDLIAQGLDPADFHQELFEMR